MDRHGVMGKIFPQNIQALTFEILSKSQFMIMSLLRA